MLNPLKKRRERLGYTQGVIADHLGISRSQYALYEEDPGAMRFRCVMKLCAAFGMDYDELAHCVEILDAEKKKNAQIRRR